MAGKKQKETPAVDPLASTPEYADFINRLNELGASSQQTTLNYIGLPGGTQVPEGGLQDPERVGKAQYYQGYSYMPQILNWSPVEKRRLQNRLVNSGLLQKDYRAGVWDEASAEAFTTILAMANQSGNDWETELINYAKQQPMEYDAKTGTMRRTTTGGGSMAQRQKLVLRYSNPNDLATLANETAQKRLGRKLSQGELQKFVSSYNSMEADYQKAADAASTGGGTVVEPMQADTAADLAAQQADPVAYATRGILPAVDAINDMLRGRDFGQADPGRM